MSHKPARIPADYLAIIEKSGTSDNSIMVAKTDLEAWASMFSKMMNCSNCTHWRSQTFTCIRTSYKSEPTDFCQDWTVR